jgi:uncharacterized membrane protein
MASNRQETSDRKLFEHEYATALHLKEEIAIIRKNQTAIMKTLKIGAGTTADTKTK